LAGNCFKSKPGSIENLEDCPEDTDDQTEVNRGSKVNVEASS